jgi:hypothetical protein
MLSNSSGRSEINKVEKLLAREYTSCCMRSHFSTRHSADVSAACVPIFFFQITRGSGRADATLGGTVPNDLNAADIVVVDVSVQKHEVIGTFLALLALEKLVVPVLLASSLLVTLFMQSSALSGRLSLKTGQEVC